LDCAMKVQTKYRMGIRATVALFACLSILIVITTEIDLGYLDVYNLRASPQLECWYHFRLLKKHQDMVMEISFQARHHLLGDSATAPKSNILWRQPHRATQLQQRSFFVPVRRNPEPLFCNSLRFTSI